MTFKTDLETEIDDVFLNSAEFAETVNYQPLTGSPFDIQVIFEDEYEGIDTESGQVINSDQPKITTKTSNFIVEPVQGDIIERAGGEKFKVSKHLPDGAGVSEILLHDN